MLENRTIYIHGGQGKAGSTAIQDYFCKNRVFYLSTHGLLYPFATKDNCNKSSNHFLMFSNKNIEVFKNKVELIRAEANSGKHNIILLSDESISNNISSSLSKEKLDILRNTFPEYSLKFILYLRRADDREKSLYCQTLKRDRGVNSTIYKFPHYLDWLKKSELLKESFENLPLHLQYLNNIFGKNNVLLRLYDTCENVVDDFIHILGISKNNNEILCKRLNVSPYDAIDFLIPLFTSCCIENIDDIDKKMISKIINNSFSPVNLNSTLEEDNTSINSTIEAIDSFCPGYANLFSKKPFSRSWPELDKNLYRRAVANLFYYILNKTNEQKKIINDHDMKIENLMRKIDKLEAMLRREQQKDER